MVCSEENQNLLARKKWDRLPGFDNFSSIFLSSYQKLTEENSSSLVHHHKWIPEVQYLIYRQESLVYIQIGSCQSVLISTFDIMVD